MNSVLLIGTNSFTSSVVTQVRGLNALTVLTAQNTTQAVHFMDVNAPDVVIAQAAELVEGSLLKTFAHEVYHAYCVVIEDREAMAGAPAAVTASERASQPSLNTSVGPKPLFDRYKGDRYKEDRYNGSRNGHYDADAYDVERYEGDEHPPKNVLLQQTTVNDAIAPVRLSHAEAVYLENTASAIESGADAYLWLRSGLSGLLHPNQARLIQAHIQRGLNRAQRYRDLSRINDWLSAVALVDALTQLSNRRAFDLELPRQIKVARSKGTPLAMMVVDIDYFKSVNDRYGHLVGDDVLKQLGKRLLSDMRFYDTPFRYGGEEFVIILSNTDITEAKVIAERLRQSIAQKPFDLPHLSPVDHESLQLPITISIGLSELAVDDDIQGRDFLHRTDQNLLKAKSLGRNRVVWQ